jgi:16S rRNA (adenine1518-N6/adenine1519-N6)-dimethyltransferase
MASKQFGQHFLEPAWVAKVVAAIDPKPGDHFIEIGPGRGALTRPLLDRADRVLAFEIDRELAVRLKADPAQRANSPQGADSLPGAEFDESNPKLTLVQGDFLDTADVLDSWRTPPLRVAGNLPYNVGSPILFRLLELHGSGVPIVDATLMFQREVAERLVARPGRREYGVLSVRVQHTADVQLVFTLPAGAFRPMPKVQSALVRITFHEPRPPVRDPAAFAALVQAIFSRRRKTLANALMAFDGSTRLAPQAALDRAAIDGRRRPETLSVEELVRLANAYPSVSG